MLWLASAQLPFEGVKWLRFECLPGACICASLEFSCKAGLAGPMAGRSWVSEVRRQTWSWPSLWHTLLPGCVLCDACISAGMHRCHQAKGLSSRPKVSSGATQVLLHHLGLLSWQAVLTVQCFALDSDTFFFAREGSKPALLYLVEIKVIRTVSKNQESKRKNSKGNR